MTPNTHAIAKYTSAVLRARAAYYADQPEARAAARAEYERKRHEKRKAGKA